MATTSCREAALDYRRAGWSVLPVRPGEKRPLIRWETLQRKHASPDDIAAWFTRWPEANVGVVTGTISGLVVLDVDPHHGGEESLHRIEATEGPLQPTVEARSGGGGRHLYFAHPGGVVRNRAGIAAGIDLRGDGGYIVAPPSRHPSGRPYAWREGRAPGDVPLAPLPRWLIAGPDGTIGPGHDFAYWRALVREGVDEGRRNTTIASLTGHLLWHGIDSRVALELLHAWNRVRCRPPLPDDEVAQVVESITRLHGQRPR